MKRTRMIKGLRGAATGLLMGGWMLLSVGCVGVVHGGGGVAFYDYNYYPDWDVYYYPAGRVYYWHDGGHWRSGGHLPERYELREHHYEQFRGHTREPWTEHH